MKEQLLTAALGASDRAALQGLIPLAGALGAGTIFALFFGGRRRGSGIAVFELFAIVAVLVAVGTTAYLAIGLLHKDEALSDQVLTQTATPLIFAVFLLVLVSVLGRLPGSVERIFAILPLIVVAAGVAAWLASSAWSFDPGETAVLAALILGVGGLAALLAWGGERVDRRWERGREQRRFVRLSLAGYEVAERELRPGVPRLNEGEEGLAVSCWVRKGKTYLDAIACRQLAAATRGRWDELADGNGRPPAAEAVLARIDAPHRMRPFGTASARFWIFRTGADAEIEPRRLEANEDGLFDVSRLGLVSEAGRTG